ncbi:SHOCT domain-containing protein [Cohnella massiliensis]|uniref:SHOCT domain-containing protein n=1 Tax=Cohnella massiliensis TaxID=1816691 RepID=UPI0009B97926|nr:SHOCT domain-containing protein [Cohnella massiliensis]
MTTSNWFVNLLVFTAVITYIIVEQKRGLNWRKWAAENWGTLSKGGLVVAAVYLVFWPISYNSEEPYTAVHVWGIIVSFLILLLSLFLIYQANSEKRRPFIAGIILADRVISIGAIILHSLFESPPTGYIWGVMTGASALFVFPFFLATLIIVGLTLSKRISYSALGEVSIPEKLKVKFEKVFVEPTEQYIASLGNGYIVNFLSGSGLERGFSILSSKRVYFKGQCFYRENSKLKRSFEERIVDLKDITGTGYTRFDPLYLFITAVVLFIAAAISLMIKSEEYNSWRVTFFIITSLVSLVSLISYLLKRRDLFEISFAGGKMAFDVNLYDKSEIDEFQKQLRRAKDIVVESAPIHKAIDSSPIKQETVNPSPIGFADELKKYAELLQQKLITEEEFAEVKKRLLFNDSK